MAKYKSVLVTADTLTKWKPCDGGLAWFKERFPKGVRISNSQDEMNELIASIENKYISNLKWFLSKLGIHTWLYLPLCVGEECLTHEAGAFLSDCSLLKDKK